MENNNKIRRRGLPVRALAAMAVLCSALLPYSCYEDKGTSPKDYTTLAELRIDTAGMGIKPAYSLKQSEDFLDISPDIYYKGQLVSAEDIAEGNLPLSFSWVLYLPTTAGITNYRIDTLSKAPSVNSVIGRGAGAYTCLFTVTDKQTNIQTYCSFGVTVTSNITEGYLVLYETEDGNTDVGLIINDWINYNTVANRMMVDLYAGTHGEALKGKPISIRQSERTYASGEVLIATERNLVGLHRNTFEITYPANKLFSENPAALDISYMGIGGNPGWTSTTAAREYVISDNKLYYTPRGNTQSSRTNHTKIGQAMGGTYGVLAPWCAMILNTSSFEAVVYDQTSTCFRQVKFNTGVEILPFTQESTTIINNAFDITNTGMQMVASDWGFRTLGAMALQSTHNEFSLMKNGANRALLVTGWDTGGTIRALAKYNLTGYPGIQDATMVATGIAGPALYYANESKIYLLTHNVPARSIQPANEFWEAPAGEKITRIVMHKNASTMLTAAMLNNLHATYTKANEVLYVATWNESTKTGTVYQINVNATTGQRVTNDEGVVPERVYTGFGKIKDMCWKWGA